MMTVGGRGGVGGRRSQRQRVVLVLFLVALLMGVAVYFRIWAIHHQDYSSSAEADDPEALRRQFERANLEAMDESAEWRMKYDGEVERSMQLQDQLLKVKASLASATRRFDMLQKDNVILQKQIESLKQHCNCNYSSSLLRR